MWWKKLSRVLLLTRAPRNFPLVRRRIFDNIIKPSYSYGHPTHPWHTRACVWILSRVLTSVYSRQSTIDRSPGEPFTLQVSFFTNAAASIEVVDQSDVGLRQFSSSFSMSSKATWHTIISRRRSAGGDRWSTCHRLINVWRARHIYERRPVMSRSWGHRVSSGVLLRLRLPRRYVASEAVASAIGDTLPPWRCY